MTPSSLPVASNPDRIGDSSIVLMLPNSAVPSCLPNAFESTAAPRMGNTSRLMARVRSGLIACQLSPRSSLLNR